MQLIKQLVHIHINYTYRTLSNTKDTNSFFFFKLLLLLLLLCVCMVHVQVKALWRLYFLPLCSSRDETQVTRLARQASLLTEPSHQPHPQILAYTFVSYNQVLPCFQSSIWPTRDAFKGLKTYSIQSHYVFNFQITITKEWNFCAAFNNSGIYLYEILRSMEDNAHH